MDVKVYINAPAHLFDKSKYDPDGVRGQVCNLAPLSQGNETELVNVLTLCDLSD